MKITIELTSEQIKELKRQLSIQQELNFEVNPKKIGLHQKTINLIDDFKLLYSKNWIYRKDKKVNDIWHKHKIHDIGNTLVRLEKFNLCEIEWNNNPNRKTINKFRFL